MQPVYWVWFKTVDKSLHSSRGCCTNTSVTKQVRRTVTRPEPEATAKTRGCSRSWLAVRGNFFFFLIKMDSGSGPCSENI